MVRSSIKGQRLVALFLLGLLLLNYPLLDLSAGPVDPAKRDAKTKELSDTTRFSIFIRGLSNGFVEVDAPAPGLPPITQYKTLQLNFKRKGDRFLTDSRDIEFVSPSQWIYRSAARTIADKKDEKKDEPKDK